MAQQQNSRLEKQLQRTVYDAQNRTSLPGEIARREGDHSTGDIVVDEVYDALGKTYDFFWSVYQRDSLDNKGMQLIATVHYGEGFANAFWNGKQLVVGDGDQNKPPEIALFNRFSISLDIIANQLVKGIIQFDSKLRYWGQAGALNETITDVFGLLVKQWVLSQTAHEANWIIGEGLFTSKVKAVGLRSMKAPGTAYDDPILGKDPQPDHMRNYVKTKSDNEGVHINSGIPNRAFYLIATELGGYAWERAGRIWYETLRSKQLKVDAQFQDFALLTLDQARQLYGEASLEVQAVKYGWEEVGIKIK